jgi:hypothetical protein
LYTEEQRVLEPEQHGIVGVAHGTAGRPAVFVLLLLIAVHGIDEKMSEVIE